MRLLLSYLVLAWIAAFAVHGLVSML